MLDRVLGVQYPGEKEITFPPFTCLEADGDPRVEHYGQGEVVVFPLKVRHPLPLPPSPDRQTDSFIENSIEAGTPYPSESRRGMPPGPLSDDQTDQ
jgi:hypothetical protein